MDDDNVLIFERKRATEIQKRLGKRPGKKYDNDYLRQSGFSGKYMFFNELTGKWVYVRQGTKFKLTDQGPRLVMV